MIYIYITIWMMLSAAGFYLSYKIAKSNGFYLTVGTVSISVFCWLLFMPIAYIIILGYYLGKLFELDFWDKEIL